METTLPFSEGLTVFERSGLSAVTASADIAGLGPEKLEEFRNKTGLNNFVVEIVRRPEQGNYVITKENSERIRDASKVIMIQGGWDSDYVSLHDLARNVLDDDPYAVVVMPSHPGQVESGFIDPSTVRADKKEASLEFFRESTKIGLEMLGYSPKQLLELNKNKKLVVISHSRAGANLFFEDEILNNPNIKSIFLAPVLKHKGLKSYMVDKLLTIATGVAGFVKNNNLAQSMSSIIDRVGDLIIDRFAGQSTDIGNLASDSYKSNFRHTDPRVLSAFIHDLMNTKMPDIKGKIDPERHMIMILKNDAFVNPVGMEKVIEDAIGDPDISSKCIKLVPGNHHGFLKPDSNAEMILRDFVNH